MWWSGGGDLDLPRWIGRRWRNRPPCGSTVLRRSSASTDRPNSKLKAEVFHLGAGERHLAEQLPGGDIGEALHVPATLGGALLGQAPPQGVVSPHQLAHDA